MSLNNLPTLSQEQAAGVMNVALTKIGVTVEKLRNIANNLALDEAHYNDIANFLNLIKDAEKVITKQHQETKAPFKAAVDNLDTAKRGLMDALAIIVESPKQAHTTISNNIAKRKRDNDIRVQNMQAVRKGIDENTLMFSAKIAACETMQQLNGVQASINLEKSETRKSKYMEWHHEAIEKYDTVLLPIIRLQKDKIKARELLEVQLKEAEGNDDVIKIDELKEKKDVIENEILQNKIDVQQAAIMANDAFEIIIPEEVLPDVKTTTRVNAEIVDELIAVKKCPTLVEVKLKLRDAQKKGMELRDAGAFKDKGEVTIDGIRYFNDTTYRS